MLSLEWKGKKIGFGFLQELRNMELEQASQSMQPRSWHS